MNSPLLYLTLCSWRNRLRVRLRRLRQPRYLIGSVVGIAYFALVLGRPLARRRAASGDPRFGGSAGALGALGASALGQFGAACLLFLAIALAWVWPSRRTPALAFTKADVQFLFTAPIPRWRLVRYKVLRSQFAALFGSALVTLFMRPGSFTQGWIFFIGFGLVMAALNLHLTGIGLTSAPVSSAARLTRRIAPGLIALTIMAIVSRDLTNHWDEIANASADGGDVAGAIARVAGSGLTGVILWPFRAIVRLPLADSAASFAAALPWTLLVIGLNYLWVLRVDVPFEEASAELADKLARVRKEGIKALRKPRPVVTTPFRLAPSGSLEAAILWKNLISMGRFLSSSMLLRVLPAFFGLGIAVGFSVARGGTHSADKLQTLAVFSLMAAAFTLVLGPQMARSDLRQDLPNLAVLRTWPMRGATLVRGEVLAPAVVLVLFAWSAMLLATIFATFGSTDMPIEHPWSLLAAAIAVTPGIILLQLLVQNALAVTFPSWVSIGAPRGGVDVMGQRMLMMVASILSLTLGLLPAALVGAGLAFGGRMLTGHVLIVVPAFAAALVLLGEAFVGTELIGAILDRTDVTALDPTDG
jgi:ABC-2 type transport system permease protein